MKKNYLLLSCLTLLPFFAACTSDDVAQESAEVEGIVLKAHDFEFADPADSRTTLIDNQSQFSFSWNEEDVVGIFPSKSSNVKRGSQLAFYPSVEPENPLDASVKSLGWVLKGGYSYAAFYPCTDIVNQDPTHILLDYKGQAQNGSASTAHLGAYDFMEAAAVTPSADNQVKFDFHHLGSLLKLTFVMPDNNDYARISIKSIPSMAIVNLFDDVHTVSIPREDVYQPLSLDVTNVEAKDVTAYMMIPACDKSNSSVEITINDIKYSPIPATNFEPGKVYAFTVAKDSQQPDPQPQPQTGWIDLGTSVLWAEKNVGATDDNPYGSYFAWNGWSQNDLGEGRLPTSAEYTDLKQKTGNNTAFEKDKLILKGNGNTLIFPAAGECWSETGAPSNVGSQGRYWTSDKKCFYFNNPWPDIQDPAFKMPIRLVKDKPKNN